jgi:hypothetical protein
VLTVRFAQDTASAGEALVFVEIHEAPAGGGGGGNGTWRTSILWQQRIRGMDGDFLPAGEQGLYFLSNPVVAFSPTRRSVAWVLLDQVFALDYWGAAGGGSGAGAGSHGYTLTLHAIDAVDGKALRVRHADLDEDGVRLALVGAEGQLLLLRRPGPAPEQVPLGPASPPPPPAAKTSGSSSSSRSSATDPAADADSEESLIWLLLFRHPVLRALIGHWAWPAVVWETAQALATAIFGDGDASSATPRPPGAGGDAGPWELVAFRALRGGRALATNWLPGPPAAGDVAGQAAETTPATPILLAVLQRRGRIRLFDAERHEGAYWAAAQDLFLANVEMAGMHLIITAFFALREL